MQRPPSACRRAAHSINSLTPTPQPHIWISDELLALTVNRFFRTGCPHQKRHGSHVPGPLEARKRAARRQMTVQAHVPQMDIGMPLFSFGAWFSKRTSPESSLRYEPPSPPSSWRPTVDSFAASKPYYSGSEEAPRTILQEPPADGIARIDAVAHKPPDVDTVAHSASQASTTPSAGEIDRALRHSKEFAKESTAHIARHGSSSWAGEDHSYDWVRGQFKKLEMKHSKTIVDLFEIFDKSSLQHNDSKALSQDLNTWLEQAHALSDDHHRYGALMGICRAGYEKRGYTANTKNYVVPKGTEASRLTVRILERLVHQNWTTEIIQKWLAGPRIPVPPLCSPGCDEFLDQLESFYKENQIPMKRFGPLSEKIRTGIPANWWKLPSHGLTVRNRKRLELLLCRAEWDDFIDVSKAYMARNAMQSVSQATDLSTSFISENYRQSLSTTKFIIAYILSLEENRRNRLWKGIYDYTLALLPGHWDTAVLKRRKTVLPKRRGVPQSQSQGYFTAEEVEWELQSSTIGSYPDTYTQKLVYAQELASLVASSRVSIPDIDTFVALLEFRSILDFACEAGMVPMEYQTQTPEELYSQHTGILHQLAYQYSVDQIRSSQENQRSVRRIIKYLWHCNLPIGPLFTKALVNVFITTPMARDDHVSAKTVIWVCQIVESVEGFEVARNIAQTFSVWKGETIKQAQVRFRELGERGPATIKTFKNLGIALTKGLDDAISPSSPSESSSSTEYFASSSFSSSAPDSASSSS